MRAPRAASLLLLALLLPLAGCHEREVTRVVRPPSRMATPDTARYGWLVLNEVREVRRPNALGAFPDGGVPIELAMYFEVRQEGGGHPPRVIGRLPMRRVRRHTFGDVLGGGRSWPAPNRLRYWIRHGYLTAEQRTDTAELEIPPLGEGGAGPALETR
ncbi:MAG TPA: hypothetical protein VFS05_03915 [Gemmatimonadaceae bacterium]|nr:hypothetical protein [Gemmatimonadaceae bacterium]